MPSKKLGLSLSKAEKRETKRAFLVVLLIILSLFASLLIEYMVDDDLQAMKLPTQIIVLTLTVLLIICISVESSKQK